MLLLILYYVALGYAGAWLVARKGYPPVFGAVAGALSGGVVPGVSVPFVFVILAILPRTREARQQLAIEREMAIEAWSDGRRQNCPKCGREVSVNAYVCPVCEFHFPHVSSKAAEIPAAGPKEN
jgi:hypothetical protein